MAVLQPRRPAHMPNPALPKAGPHSQPAPATAIVVTPSTTNGSIPETWAPHESMSLLAIRGAATPTVTMAEATEAARLMNRLLRRKSKKRSQVRTFAGGSPVDEAPGAAVEAFRRTVWLAGELNPVAGILETMEERGVGMSTLRRSCFNGRALLLKEAVGGVAEKMRAVCATARRQDALVHNVVAIVFPVGRISFVSWGGSNLLEKRGRACDVSCPKHIAPRLEDSRGPGEYSELSRLVARLLPFLTPTPIYTLRWLPLSETGA